MGEERLNNGCFGETWPKLKRTIVTKAAVLPLLDCRLLSMFWGGLTNLVMSRLAKSTAEVL